MKNYTFLTLAFLLSFFIANNSQASPQIIINEIAWMGNDNSANDEWIELKNPNEETININEWELLSEDESINIKLLGEIPPNGFFLLERTDDNSVPGINADQIYVGTLGNDGEIISLYDADHNLIDSIDASQGWPGGNNETKQTLEKSQTGSWQTSSLPLGTPGENNSQSEITISETEDINSNKDICYLGDILISEFITDPSESENEWIELYNTIYRDIDLEDWTIEDGSGTITNLSGTILKNNFLIVDNPKGKLNNDGDTIILRDQNQVIIDQVSYGNWDDGDTSDNAPKTNDPNSIARQKENYNTRNNSLDFFITTTPTKNASNIITPPKDETKKEEDTILSSEIYINEILPNPIGTDYEDEFIELYNNGTEEINLENWIIKSSVNEYKIKEKIKAKKYLLIYRKDSGLILKNDSETVSLISEKNKTIQKISFKDAPIGYSYNLNSENNWSWEKNISPGEDNIIKIINQAPQVQFYCPDEAKISERVFFDSSDTYDPDSEKLNFSWNFGDGFKNTLPNPEHTFLKTGIFLIDLEVSDGENIIHQERKIKINYSNKDNKNDFLSIDTKNIIINEIMPNPETDENNEWIEIYNQGNTKINLFNWKLDDSANGSSPYTFSDFNIEKNSYQIIPRSESKIILNNDFDSVRLFDNQDNLIEEIKYENSPSGQSYARGLNGKWFWTETPTPRKTNNISLTAENSYQVLSSAVLIPETTETKNNTPLSEIKNKKIGDKIITQGIVAVLPGILGSQFFYINEDSTGLQIYSYKKDFPEINLGDLIEIEGELSQINDEWRLKIKTATDIKIIEQKKEIEIEYFACGEINENYLGRLILTGGEIVEKKGSIIYLDDGTGELAVYLKAGANIDSKNYQENDYAEITGILSQTSSGIKLMPRSIEDIKMKNNAEELRAENQELRTLEIPARDSKNNTLKYFFITLISTLIIIGILIFRRKRSN